MSPNKCYCYIEKWKQHGHGEIVYENIQNEVNYKHPYSNNKIKLPVMPVDQEEKYIGVERSPCGEWHK